MRKILLIGVLAGLLVSSQALATSFLPLGDLPGGGFFSQAFGVSADGSTVVGGSNSQSSIGPEAFRWTAGGGMVGLGDLPGGFFNSRATGVQRKASGPRFISSEQRNSWNIPSPLTFNFDITWRFVDLAGWRYKWNR